MAGSRKGVAKAAPALKNGDSPLIIEIDMDNMTIGDLGLFDEFKQAKFIADRTGRKPDYPMGKMVSFLDRIVVGGVSHLPYRRLAEVMDLTMTALGEEMRGINDEENPLDR